MKPSRHTPRLEEADASKPAGSVVGIRRWLRIVFGAEKKTLASAKVGELTAPEAKRSYQPLTLVLLTVGIFVFAQVIAAVLIGIYALATGQDETIFETITQSNLANFLLVVMLSLLQFAGIIWALRYTGSSLRSIGLVWPVGKDILRAGAGWLVYIVVLVVAASLLGAFDAGVDFEQEQQIDFVRPTESVELVFIFVSLVIVPAFIEELLMRGFLFFGLRKHLGFLKSTLIVSVLFGAAHLQPGSGEPLLWAAFVDTFILSAVLCTLTEKSRSLAPAIIIHAVKNSIAFVYLFVL